MAENKKRNNEYKASQREQEAQAAAPKASPKKILIVVAAIVAVVAVSLFIDYTVKNPSINDSLAASNRIYGEGVLGTIPEVAIDDVPVDVILEEAPRLLDGKEYWLVLVETSPGTPEVKSYNYYVAQKDGKIYTLGADNKLVPYGV